MRGIVDIKIMVVAIISNNYFLRLGLQKIVDDVTWIRLVGYPAHASILEEILSGQQPHIVILDSEIGDMTSQIIQQIKRAAPETKTILLSGLEDTDCTRQAFSSGVDSVVLKIQPSAVLIATINHLAHGTGEDLLPVSKPPIPLTLNHPTTIPTTLSATLDSIKRLDGLTEREQEVVRLVSEGLTNKDIANRLCISSITVRHHLTSIFDKLGVSNRQKLLLHAHQSGLTRPPALA